MRAGRHVVAGSGSLGFEAEKSGPLAGAAMRFLERSPERDSNS
jgi:hypothetical protein